MNGDNKNRLMDPREASRLAGLWRYSCVLTIPLFLFALLWLAPAWQGIKNFVLVHPSIDQHFNIDSQSILEKRLRFLFEQTRWTFLNAFGLVPVSILPVYAMQIAPEHLAEISEHLPGSGRKWIPAQITMPDGTRHKIKARLRGDSMHHWGFEAKSWRIRFPREKLVDGERRMDFIVPRRIGAGSYYLPLRMAQDLNLLAPTPKFVELHINGRPLGGVHFHQEVIEEGFLRHKNRLPGDIFVGDMVLKDAFPREQGIGPSMWALPRGWSKVSHNSKFSEKSDAPLERLLLVLAGSSSVHGHRSLKKLLDLDAWARLAAWLQLTGSSHFDYGHNWVLYFDEGRQTFEPIVRDGNGLGDNLESIAEGSPGLDVGVTSPIMVQLHKDHEFLRIKEQAVADFLAAGKDHALRAELDRVAANVANALRRFPQINWRNTDQNRTSVSYMYADEFLADFKKHQRALDTWFGKQRSVHQLEQSSLKITAISSDTLRLRLSGYAGIRRVEIPLSAAAASVQACLRYRIEGETEICEPIDHYVTVQGRTLRLDLALLAGRRLVGVQTGGWVVFRRVETVPATYDVVLQGADLRAGGEVAIEGLNAERFEIVPGESFPPESLPADTREVVPYRPVPTYWVGEMQIRNDLDISGDLFVAAGSHLRLDPNVTITVRGRLMLEGQKNAPVTIDRADPDRPWGALVVIGRGGDGSRLKHCTIAGGSGQKGDFHLYSGMLEVRNVRNFEIDECLFRDNAVFDDMLHFSYVEGRVRNTRVQNAVGDCIDVDISSVTFENVVISRCGNDGLDLMTSRVLVKDGEISGAGDKGISIGEKTLLRVDGAVIQNSEIGVQGKDASQAHIRRSRLLDNMIQVSGFHKNARYPGDALILLDGVEISGRAKEIFDIKENNDVIVLGGQYPAAKNLSRVFMDPSPDSPAAMRAASLVKSLSVLDSLHPASIK